MDEFNVPGEVCNRVGLRRKVVGDMIGWLGSDSVRMVSERPWVQAQASHNFSPVTNIQVHVLDLFKCFLVSKYTV